MKSIFKKIMAIVLVVSLSIVCSAFPVAALEESEIINISTFERDIEVSGIMFHVSITTNADGTKNVIVEGDGSTVSWTTDNAEEEPLQPQANVVSDSYSSFRYTHCSTAAVPWYLYRPLQNDGGSSTKGVSYNDSEFCRRFAEEIASMNAADDRISFYLKNNDLAANPGSQILLGAVGGYAGFYVATTLIASTIAGAVGVIISSYAIPAIWEAAISELVEAEYANIRTAMGNADNYYELA